MKQKTKKTSYDPDWENPELYPDISKWIAPVKTGASDDVYWFRCKICGGRKLALSNMGIQAVKSHQEDNKNKNGEVTKSKHNKNMDALQKTRKDCWTAASPSPSPSNNNSQTGSAESVAAAERLDRETPDASVEMATASKQTIIRLDSANSDVVRAWILYALDVVHSHRSLNSSGNKGDLFRKMFPGHPNAENFGDLSRTKLRYMIVHGLAYYYKNQIFNDLAPKNRLPRRFSSCFDESYNKVTYSKQLDVHVLYFDEERGIVQRKYIGSQFMGHATAKDTMKDFKEAHRNLNIVSDLVQLSMDGPNVNWKFHDDLEEHRKDENPEAPDLLQLGSCGIHVLHGAYKTAHTKETDWEVQEVLKAAHGVFKKSPARRADYLDDNEIENDGDDQTLKGYFPLKFAGHRWLENGKCLVRYLEIYSLILNFLRKSNDMKRKNFGAKDERKPLLLKATSSVLFAVYCEFSLSICRDIEPFLTLFQAERPLSPFLYSKLLNLVLVLLSRFVKKSVIDECNRNPMKLLKIDLREEKNLLSLDAVNVGFGARKHLKQLKTQEKTQERKFRTEARGFLACVLEKIFERSPLKFKLTRPISSLSPLEISSKPSEVLMQRFTKLCEILHENNWLTAQNAERAENQYAELLDKKDFKKAAEKFDLINDRVDVFWSGICDSNGTIDLENIVRLVLILSHGNARVESGFSINGDILLPNQLCESIIAQRMVYEGISKAGGVTQVDITPEMMKDVRGSHRRHNLMAEEKRKKQSDGQKKMAEKRKLTTELKKAVEEKKAKLDAMKEAVLNTDREINELQEKLRS